MVQNEQPFGIATMTERAAAATPGHMAVILDDVALDYGALHDRVLRCVAALRSAAVTAGDRVGYLGMNSIDYVVLMIAMMRIGAVTVPINWRLSAREIGFIAADAGLMLLVTEAERVALAPDSVPVILCDASCGDYPPFADWIAGFAPDAAMPQIAPDAVAIQLYTSGTTGHPKGALLTHGALGASVQQGALTGEAWAAAHDDDVALIAMPQFHIGGTGWTLQTLHNGTTAVLLRRPEIADIITAVAEHRITKMFAVPAVLGAILDHPLAADADLSSLRVLLYGASPIPLDILKRSIALFPNAAFVQLYGATETSGTIVYLPPEDHAIAGNRRMRGCGKPYPQAQLRIVGQDGQQMPTGQVGEVQVRSPVVMRGYHNLPDATRAAFDGDWYRTGDAGSLDADGYLYLFDRVQDMICSGAENIYPAEVENVLHQHPDVRDCAVIAVPDARWGEAVKAVVVRTPGSALGEADLIGFARERIATFKAPKSVDFVADLPRNAAGKILKRELRRRYWPDGERAIG